MYYQYHYLLALYYILTHLKIIGDLTRSYRELTNNNLGNGINILIFIFGILIVLFRKNSSEKVKAYKLEVRSNIEITIYMTLGIFLLTQVSEFLYFNF